MELKVDFWRQLDFYPNDRNDKVVVIGAGSIGSYTTFGLARMGVKYITVIDYDKVENHNLPNQFFSEHELMEGIPKVLALEKTINMIIKDCKIMTVDSKIEASLDSMLNTNPHVIIVTVDNMKTRKFIYDELIRQSYRGWLIDARVGGENVNIFTVDMSGRIDDSRQQYKETIWEDSEVPELPCSARSVVDISMGVSAQLINRTRHCLLGKPVTYYTFHDYVYGVSYVMEHGNANPPVVEEESVTHIGGSDGEN